MIAYRVWFTRQPWCRRWPWAWEVAEVAGEDAEVVRTIAEGFEATGAEAAVAASTFVSAERNRLAAYWHVSS